MLGILKSKNFRIITMSKSFPANSEIKSQTTWSTNIKNKITNTVVNVIKKDFNKYRSSIFTSSLIYFVDVVIGIFTRCKGKLIF
jgi:hypothetical protein